jgi:hypothetical protein
MKEEKVYEVVHSVRIKPGEDRNRGDEIKASELAAGDVESFLAQGIIRDPEAPVTGSTTDLAHDRLLSIAQKLGVVTVKGSAYRMGDKKAKGLTAFRDLVSLDDLQNAIVEAFEPSTAEADLEALQAEHTTAQKRIAELEAQLAGAKK